MKKRRFFPLNSAIIDVHGWPVPGIMGTEVGERGRIALFFHSLRGLQGLFAGNKVYHGSNIPCNVACVSSISRDVHPRRTSVID